MAGSTLGNHLILEKREEKTPIGIYLAFLSYFNRGTIYFIQRIQDFNYLYEVGLN